MIIQVFNANERVVKIKIIGKDILYSDSVDYRTYVPFIHLLKNAQAIQEWTKRIKELKTEQQIADEIRLDMKKFGFKLIKEMEA